MSQRPGRIDSDRLMARIMQFAAIGGTPAGGVNRQAQSIEDRRACALLANLALARGFSLHQDGKSLYPARGTSRGRARRAYGQPFRQSDFRRSM